MPRNPVTDDCGELTNLELGDFDRVYIERKYSSSRTSGAVIARIEAAVNACLSEEIDLRADLCVEEQG